MNTKKTVTKVNYPIGIQSFEKIRKGGFVYVDKTDLVYKLAQGSVFFLAETPYAMRPKKDQKDRELYFHYTFYLLMRLISCYTVYTEKQLSEGRADCIVETPQYVYIFEFLLKQASQSAERKLDGTAQEALQQIADKGYAKAYEADRRRIYKIGASFSSKTGTVEEWLLSEE